MRKSSLVATITVVVALSAAWVVAAGSATAAGAAVPVAAGGAAPDPSAAGGVPTSIPVFDWHELNNGCKKTVAVCNASDPESVSTTQLTAELSYLKAQNDHTISPAQYMAWTEGSQATLPVNPVLLIADNGIKSFLVGAQPILKADGFTMAVAVISGFADGATEKCSDPSYQPGCPTANDDGWDATWAQLEGLSPSVYSFILEAGAAGHFVQTYDPNCTVFYACVVPGESTTAYETRVETDLSVGQAEIISRLGVSRFTVGLWVVPYSDDGYTPCAATSCTLQTSDGPSGWLPQWTASNFPVSFVEDSFRNGLQNERFRIDVQGWMTEAEFESTVTQDITAGDFTLANTPPAPPLPVPPTSPPTTTNPVADIPVLSLDSTTVTATQVEEELAYLQSQGYNAISAADYVSWAQGSVVALPANPILLTVTGGNDVLLAAITPYLVSAGMSAVDFVSTQQADAGGTSATWAQLAALTPAAWQFSFGSGSTGGTAVLTDPGSCDIFYACEAPGETDAAYESRASSEIGAGRLKLDNDLWMQTVNDYLWSAPFGDAGQPGQESNGPIGWLAQWASYVFPVVFVSNGASGDNEHNVLVVTGSTTEASFELALASEIAVGSFNG